MIYLASPYSHADPDVRQQRYDAVCRYLVGELAESPNDVIYSPIAFWHPIAVHHKLPTDHLFWLRQNTMYIRLAREVRVLMLTGWKDSKGVQQEVDLAIQLFTPVHFVLWGLTDAYT